MTTNSQPSKVILVGLLLLSVLLCGCAAFPSCHRQSCMADRDITRAVNRLLKNYPSLQPPNSVRVETTNRVVYLYGQVNNEVERSMAQQAAQSVNGVVRVVNSISFQYEGR
jgi:osmotically-inducible protein OsmY